jgi:hypothetical protein
MYPCGQPGLPDDQVTTYINGLRTAGAAPGSTTTGRARTARRHDPTRECNVCVATASSSSESEPAPCHRGADDQRRRDSTNLRRQGAISTRSWHFYTGSSAWKPSHASDNQHRACWCKAKPTRGMAIDARYRTFLCRVSLARRTTTGANADQLQISRVVAHLRRPRAHQSPTTIDAPMEAQMPTPMHHHSSGGRPRTWLLQPCCYAAARSPQLLRSGVCGSS